MYGEWSGSNFKQTGNKLQAAILVKKYYKHR